MRQLKLSNISFGIRPTREWDEDKRSYAAEASRQADLYVFALLAHQEKPTVDPLELDQWHFYVVSTAQLNTLPPVNSINLKTVQRLCPKAYHWRDLHDVVTSIAAELAAKVRHES